jgi:hypothetical protein
MADIALTLSTGQASWLYCLLFQVTGEYQNGKTDRLKTDIENAFVEHVLSNGET